MADHDDDLRTFIRQQTAKMDRSWRRLEKVIERNSEVIEEARIEFAANRRQREDEQDERRALTNAVMTLIDKTEELGRKIDPGPAGA